MEHFQQIHIAGGKFKGPEIMESSQEIHRASGYFRGPGSVAHSQLIYRAGGIDLQQLPDILHMSLHCHCTHLWKCFLFVFAAALHTH